MVLAHAMETAGTTVPVKVAEALHFIQDWQGITAAFTFNQQGDVLDSVSGFKVLTNGKFIYDMEINRKVTEQEKKLAEEDKEGYEEIVLREIREDVDTMDGDKVNMEGNVNNKSNGM